MFTKRAAIGVFALTGMLAVGWHFYGGAIPQLQKTQEAARPHEVTLTWEKSKRAVSYNVYRRAYRGDDTFVKVGSSEANEYVDTTVQSEMRYCYVVTAIDNKGHESAKSKEFCVTIPHP